MLVHILELMLEDKDFTGSISKSKQEAFYSSTSQLVKQITEILSTVSKNVSLKRDLRDHLFSDEEVKTISEEKINNIVEEYEILETDFYSYLIRVLKSCLSISPGEVKLFYKSDFIKNGIIINVLALHPNKETMKKFADSMRDFCSLFRTNTEIDPNPAQFFIQMFAGQLKNVLSYDTLENTEFFNLWDGIIRLVNPKDITKELLDTSDIAKSLFATINSKNIYEDDLKQDSILAGALRMLTTLDELFHSELKTNVPALYSKEFLNFLLANGLWSREKPEDMSSENTDEVSFPLCKHGNTRKYAYKLVNQIFGATNMNEIAKFMEPYIKSGSWRTNKRDKWFIQSSKLNQRNTYVGLVNLGCT
jgi:hypothetical protein